MLHVAGRCQVLWAVTHPIPSEACQRPMPLQSLPAARPQAAGLLPAAPDQDAGGGCAGGAPEGRHYAVRRAGSRLMRVKQ